MENTFEGMSTQKSIHIITLHMMRPLSATFLPFKGISIFWSSPIRSAREGGREGGSPHKFSVKIRFPLYRTEERRNSPTPSPRSKSGDARRRSGTNRVVQIPSLPFKSCCPIVHIQTAKNAREKIYEENGKPFYEVCSSVRSRKYFFATP